MDVKVRFLEPFVDYNYFPRMIKMDEEMVIEQTKLDWIKASGATVEVIESYIPKPKKSDAKA